MDTTLEEQMGSTFEHSQEWIQPPKKGFISKHSKDPLLFSSLEEAARAMAQACILSYGIRFEPSAISALYTVIEEGIINIRKLKHEDDLGKISDAQKNLAGFIHQIVTTCKNEGLTSVDDKKVTEIRKTPFCPVYPFK